jgi:2'-5' RNA ligase
VSETAVIVPVPEAEPAFAELRRAHDPSAADGMGCHITVMYPFLLPGLLDEDAIRALRASLACVAPFTLTLARLERFSGDAHVLYAVPEPAEPFIFMTDAVSERFHLAPYGGAHETVRPHLTIAVTDDERLLDRIAPAVAAGLPITSGVDRVDVAVHEPRGWRTAHTIPLV